MQADQQAPDQNPFCDFAQASSGRQQSAASSFFSSEWRHDAEYMAFQRPIATTALDAQLDLACRHERVSGHTLHTQRGSLTPVLRKDGQYPALSALKR